MKVKPRSKKGVFGFIQHNEKSFKRLLRKMRPGYKLTGKYTGYKTPVQFTHSCGLKFIASPEVVGKNNKCKKCICECSKSTKHTEQSIKHRLELGDYDWTLKTFDAENPERSLWKNKHCGHKAIMSYKKVIGYPRKAGTTCGICHKNKLASREIKDSDYQKMYDTKFGKGAFKILKTWKTIRSNGNTVKSALIEHSCGNTFNCDSIFDRYRNTSNTCPGCKTTFKYVDVGGRTFYVQGVEDIALDYIIKHKKINACDIVTHQDGGSKVINYKYVGKAHSYHPDFWIPDKNIIVEVKTLESLGFGTGFYSYPENYGKNCAKAKACVKKGYNYKMIVMDRRNNRRVHLPDNWYNFKLDDLRKALGLPLKT